MIKAKILKRLLDEIPDEALLCGYEGEDTGIGITYDNLYWWIRATQDDDIDDYIEGFEYEMDYYMKGK